MPLSYLANSSGEDECRRRLPKTAKLSYLDRLLICTNDTPVVNMLAHSSPPYSLSITSVKIASLRMIKRGWSLLLSSMIPPVPHWHLECSCQAIVVLSLAMHYRKNKIITLLHDSASKSGASLSTSALQLASTEGNEEVICRGHQPEGAIQRHVVDYALCGESILCINAMIYSEPELLLSFNG